MTHTSPLVLSHNQLPFSSFPFSPTQTTTRTSSAVNIYTTNWPTSRSSYRSTTNISSAWTTPGPNEAPPPPDSETSTANTPRGAGGSRCWAERHRAGLDGGGWVYSLLLRPAADAGGVAWEERQRSVGWKQLSNTRSLLRRWHVIFEKLWAAASVTWYCRGPEQQLLKLWKLKLSSYSINRLHVERRC